MSLLPDNDVVTRDLENQDYEERHQKENNHSVNTVVRARLERIELGRELMDLFVGELIDPGHGLFRRESVVHKALFDYR